MTRYERLAVGLMIAQGVLFAAETVIIHHIGVKISLAQLAFLRDAAGLALACGLACQTGRSVICTRQLLLQFLRGIVSLVYLWIMIYSFVHLPLADATAICYTQIAYIAVFSAWILGEQVSRPRWSAVAIGIVGAVLMVQPTFASSIGVGIIPFIGAGLNGLAFVLNRYLQRQDANTTPMFYTNLVVTLENVSGLAFSKLPSPETLLYLPAIVLLGAVAMYAGVVAVRHANTTMLGPFSLIRLPLAILIGFALFDEELLFLSCIGTGLIAVSCFRSLRLTASGKPGRGSIPACVPCRDR